MGRRSPPIAPCATCADGGFAPSQGVWSPSAAIPFLCNNCGALDSAKRRDAVVAEYENRCGPLLARKDLLVASSRMVDLRLASLVELRGAVLRLQKHLPPANTSRLEDALRQGSEVPSDGTSLLLMSA